MSLVNEWPNFWGSPTVTLRTQIGSFPSQDPLQLNDCPNKAFSRYQEPITSVMGSWRDQMKKKLSCVRVSHTEETCVQLTCPLLSPKYRATGSPDWIRGSWCSFSLLQVLLRVCSPRKNKQTSKKFYFRYQVQQTCSWQTRHIYSKHCPLTIQLLITLQHPRSGC